jgi:capsular exopolysaccharide synthesis family protein
MTTTLTQPEPAHRGDLERILGILRRRVVLIVAAALLTAGIALGVSFLQQKQYSASASLLFRNPGFAEDLFGTAASSANPSPTREAATNEKLVGLEVIAERTAGKLRGLTSDQVDGMVDISSEGEAEVVAVTATSPDPRRSQMVANTFARQFIAFRAHADRSKLLQAKHLAERELSRLPARQQFGARGQALSRSAERLGVLASLQTGNAELVQPADLPSSPSSPKPLRNGLIGLGIGILLGLALALLLERLNRKLREPEELREAFDLPVLATIPESKELDTAGNGASLPPLSFSENESFRILSAALRYFNVDTDLRSVLITSNEAGVGKSTVAWNLARVAASSRRTVLVETDLRNPSFSRQRDLAPGPGLAELLTNQVQAEQAIQTRELASGADGEDPRSFDVIVAGAVPPNPGELIESQAMRNVLEELSERYELVIVDTPPIGVVADAFSLLRQVGGVIAVARMGHSTWDSAQQLREQLGRLQAPMLGVVANGVSTNRGRFAYGYYGDYARAAQAVAEPSRG